VTVDWRLVFDVIPVDAAGEKRRDHAKRPDQQNVVLSVTAMSGLPEAVVRWAGDNEIFYEGTAVKQADLSPEGQVLRQKVSADWIRQYYAVRAQYTRVVPRSEIEAAVASVVEAFRQEGWF
jgi:hypothetical protein